MADHQRPSGSFLNPDLIGGFEESSEDESEMKLQDHEAAMLAKNRTHEAAMSAAMLAKDQEHQAAMSAAMLANDREHQAAMSAAMLAKDRKDYGQFLIAIVFVALVAFVGFPWLK